MNSIMDRIKDITAISRIKIIGIMILTLSIVAPASALAGWQVYYTGKAAGMFGYGGRGNFSTRAECDVYRISRPGFESNNSYCSGFDAPSQKSSPQGSPVDEGTAAREQENRLQKEQQEREQELARQKMFAEEKDKLLGTLKGTGAGTLSGCIEKDRACVLNGTPCCAPYSCIGKFPNTSCGIRRGIVTDLGLKTGLGSVDPKILKEQADFDKRNAEWMKKQKKLVEQRLKEPNKYAGALYASLKTNAPPPPWKTFNELQPCDVLLIEGSAIAYVDNKLSAGNNASKASHTVIYLKEVNGKKLFLDNQPNQGPRIISEEEFLRLYGHRGTEVAKLAQPLNEKEGKKLFATAVEMAQKNNKQLINKDTWFGKYLFTDTNYGAWGKNNVVCSESDWALINATGRTIPHSDNILKLALGLNFSPSDFYNSTYFMVTPLW